MGLPLAATTASAAAATMASSRAEAAAALAAVAAPAASTMAVTGPVAYKVGWRRSLAPAGAEAWRAKLARSDVVLLGEHHDSEEDHALHLDVLCGLFEQSAEDGRSLAVGLEMVQKRFQPVLDHYVEGKLDERGLARGTDWRRRWTWPFELYEPVLRFCREQGVRLVALNTDYEVLAKVESGGLEQLTAEDWQANVPDRTGFRMLGKDPAFKAYLGNVVVPAYRLHERLGILRQTLTGQVLEQDMTLKHFVGGRVLWDETMAGSAVKAVRDMGGPGRARLAVLVGNDHVKYHYGIKERVCRLARKPLAGAGPRAGRRAAGDAPWHVTSVVTNPRASDGLLRRNGMPVGELELQMKVPAPREPAGSRQPPAAGPLCEVPLSDLLLCSPENA